MPEKLINLYKKIFKANPEHISELKAHSSEHKLFRLSSKNFSCLGVFNENSKENIAFVKFTEFFRKAKLPVPEVYIVSGDNKYYLEEDLGNLSLFDFIKKFNKTRAKKVNKYYETALNDLIEFQIKGREVIDFKYCYQTKKFGYKQIYIDLKKFEDYCLPLILRNKFNKLHKSALIKEMLNIVNDEKNLFFMYRDFQPRNIMINKDKLYYIDFQSGRLGPMQYDVASLLFSGSIIIDNVGREELIEYYINSLNKRIHINKELFIKNFYPIAFIRILQMLGSYGYNYRITGNYEFKYKTDNAFENLKTMKEKMKNRKLKFILEDLLTNKNEIITHTLKRR